MDDLLEEAYEKKEEDFINLIESYSPGKNDNIISEYILKLYQMHEVIESLLNGLIRQKKTYLLRH